LPALFDENKAKHEKLFKNEIYVYQLQLVRRTTGFGHPDSYWDN
jgi:hypothetical protein